MKTKCFCATLAAFLTLALAAAAFGASMSFAKFTVEAPNGWQASEDDKVVLLLAPENVAAISIAVDKTGGASAKELVTAISQQLNGSEPQAEDGGGYTFTFQNKHGVASKAVLHADADEYVLLTITGEHPQIPMILKSIQDK